MKTLIYTCLVLLLLPCFLHAQASLDPCQNLAKSFVPINQAAAGPLTIVAGSTSKKIHICSMFLKSAAGASFNLIEGTGANCSSVSAGVTGGTTAATGLVFASDGGFVMGTGGFSVAATATAADNLCLITGGTVQVSGVLGYVKK
jgi:hypothetical protein